MYEVLLESRAERDLRRLPRDILARVAAALQGLAEVPRPPGAGKHEGSRSDWRLRVGEHRILYEVDDRRREVSVMRIRHRREAYRQTNGLPGPGVHRDPDEAWIPETPVPRCSLAGFLPCGFGRAARGGPGASP
jgi:mRNA interferase RelE/StbE